MAMDITAKWGKPVAERGFAQLPNYLLFINQFLDKDHRLSPVELLVLFQLVGTWWKKGDLPFPSMGTLAVRCGVSDRQIQRAVNELEKVGLIRRVNRRIKGIISSNAYDLGPLVSILEEIAKAFPNEFPRNVDRATVKAISSRLGTPYTIVLDPSGALANSFLTLDHALETARELEKTGHKIRSINRGEEILEGQELRAALGENTPPEFVNFPSGG